MTFPRSCNSTDRQDLEMGQPQSWNLVAGVGVEGAKGLEEGVLWALTLSYLSVFNSKYRETGRGRKPHS